MSRARLLTCFACLLLVSPLHAQSLTGSFTGRVTDPAEGALPQVNVIVVNAETGVQVYTTKSDAQGFYRAPSLRAGTYHLAFEVAGFKRTEVRNAPLLGGESAQIDVALEPGALTDAITIAGEQTAVLEKESSAIDETFTFAQVQNLPLPGRGFVNLLNLVGGVAAAGAAGTISNNVISINGGRPLNNEFTVEGVSVLNGTTGAPATLPSTEAIREVKVQTAAYSAEFGRSSGGYMNAIVNSGTKDFHGGLYEYFRNGKLNANNFFNNARGIARPSSRSDLFGGKFGGPLPLPRLGEGGPVFSNNRERAFFFFNYEGRRSVGPNTTISTIPDLQFRGGDFSSSPVLIRDPLRQGNCTAADRTACFPGNRIPESRLDPAARRILSLILPPNSAGNADAANGRSTNNLINALTLNSASNQINLRIDTSGNAGRTRVFGRLFAARALDPNAPFLPGQFDPATNATAARNYQGNLGYTQILNTNLIAEANLGYFRNNETVEPRLQNVDVAALTGINRAPSDLLPRITISGFRDLGAGPVSYRTRATNTIQPSASLSWTGGANLLKLGWQLRKNQYNVFEPNNIQGNYVFTGEISSSNRAAGNPINALADFLLGQVKTASYELAQPLVGRRNYNLGFYVQDDWKVTPRLTLNLGVRWEYESPVVEVNDIYSRVDPTTGRLLVAGRNADRALNVKADRNNFAPRVGFAYSLDDKTVLRSAFGIFYAGIFTNLGGAVNFPGFTIQQNFPNLGIGVAQPFTLSQGFPLVAVRTNDPFAVERAATVDNPLAPTAQFAEISPLPQTLQLTVNLQRELFAGVMAEAIYIGSRGLYLPLDLPFNQIPFERAEEIARDGTTAARQRARPFPTIGGFNARVHGGTSTYHSLQLKGRRQFGSGLTFVATYTWAKSLDDGSGVIDAGVPNGLDAGQYPSRFRFLDRAVSSFDLPHNFSAAAVYTQERGPSFLRGFQISPTVQARAGFPDTIAQTNLNPAVNQQRPSVVGDYRNLYTPELIPEGVGIRYLRATNDPQFPLVPTGPLFVGTGANRRLVLPASIGTLGRNTIREPGQFDVNVAVSKSFKLTEELKLMCRAEAFNLFNRTNFDLPNSALAVVADANGNAVFNSPNFGLITVARAARSMQLVLRLDF